MDVNLKAVFLLCKEAIKLMLANGGGAIVTTASTASVVGFPENAAYTASKHAVVGFTKS